MADKRTKSVRLPADLADEIEDRATENDVSESDVLRRVIERGLREDERDKELAELRQRLARIEERLREPLWKRLL